MRYKVGVRPLIAAALHKPSVEFNRHRRSPWQRYLACEYGRMAAPDRVDDISRANHVVEISGTNS
jgi:hypothetical protein